MFVRQIYLNTYSAASIPSGSITIEGPEAKVELQLTENEARQLTALALNFFSARQQVVAQSIADMRVLSLEGPKPVPEPEHADFTEVDDDVPF